GSKRCCRLGGAALCDEHTQANVRRCRVRPVKIFKLAGIEGTSHMFRHTFSVELLKTGVDIRKVSKALGHSSVTITERYYAKWNKAQQDILDGDLARAWKK